MQRTDYDVLMESAEGKRLLRQEELLVDAQDEIALAMRRARASKADLAKALDKSRSFVTQVLSSGRNLTLRTWADIATALGHRVIPKMTEEGAADEADIYTVEDVFRFADEDAPRLETWPEVRAR